MSMNNNCKRIKFLKFKLTGLGEDLLVKQTTPFRELRACKIMDASINTIFRLKYFRVDKAAVNARVDINDRVVLLLL